MVLGQVTTRYTIRHLDEVVGDIRGKSFQVASSGPGRPGYALSLDAFADMLSDDGDRRVLERNLNLLMKQDLVRTAYEHIAHYCEERGCFDRMKAQSWWMFARIIRNTISHKTGAQLHRWPKDAPDSVTWRGHTISKSDLGADIAFEADEAWHLFDEMAAFARTLT